MIEILDFTKYFGAVCAVDNLNLRIEEGEVFGLIGSNGAGKTTIFRFLATLLESSGGTAFVNNFNVASQIRQVRRSIGFMPDELGYYPGMRVWEFLDFFAAAYHIKRWRRADLIDDLLELMDLGDKRYELVDGLSRGMKQRLGLAKTLVHDPPVLILDEPASGLDPRARVEIKELLRELTSMGKTILISSHILSELSDICTSIGIIERGRLLTQGKMEKVLSAVREHRIYELRLIEGADRALSILENHDLVFDLETGSNRFRFGFKGTDEDAADLIATLVMLEVRVSELREEPIDLEEAFFKHTKGEVA